MSNDTGTGTAYARLVQALRNIDQLFTHQQMSWLMGFAHQVAFKAGFDAGYRARVAEENAAYPPEPYGIADGNRIGSEQLAARSTADADRSQRYEGGAVPVWDATRPDEDFGPSAARWHTGVGVPLRQLRNGSLAWREDA